MTIRGLVLAAPFAAAALLSANQQGPFRSKVDAVSLAVSVRQGNRPVAGLTKSDFELRDNNQVQAITQLSEETAAIELTLLVDVSGSVQGRLLTSLTKAIERVRLALRPADRVNLVTFNQAIRDIAGSGSRHPDAFLPLLEPSGPTSLLDAISASLIRPSDPEQRQMMIVFTDGADTMSFLDESTVIGVAGHTEAAIFVVAATDASVFSQEDVPHQTLFEKLTTLTGGRLAVLPRAGDLGNSFLQALEEFRTGYLLHYTLQGPNRPGWHDIVVRVTRPGRFVVRARQGYAVER